MKDVPPSDPRNPFGIPLTVGSHTELEAGVAAKGGTYVHLVVRVADSAPEHVVRARWPALADRRRKIRCSRCRELCWFDPDCALIAATRVVVCEECMPDYIDAHPEHRPTGEGLGAMLVSDALEPGDPLR